MILLLASLGLAFGLQYRAGPTIARWTGLDRWRPVRSLLSCSYCAGFHAGWIAWLLDRFGPPVLVWAFAAAAAALLFDGLTRFVGIR